MVDLVYKTLLTIINKENSGYITPTEFNLLANRVQESIFRGYFEDENMDKNKENRGLSNKGYSNLSFNQRQRINQFSDFQTLTLSTDRFNLPSNLYLIEDDGITVTSTGRVIDEVERSRLGFLNRSQASPTEVYPVYERYGDNIRVSPATISEIDVRFLRKPSAPKWTYTIVGGKEFYDPSNASFQDFELHSSEFSNIVVHMLSDFGINLREADVVQIAETLKNSINVKDNQ